MALANNWESTRSDPVQPPRDSCHLAIVTSTFPVLSETFVVDHVKGLMASGWVVSVIAGRIDRQELEAEFTEQHVRPTVYSLPVLANAGLLNLLKYGWQALKGLPSHAQPHSVHARLIAIRAQRLRDVMAKIQPDLIHAHFGPNGIVSALALDRRPVPLIVNFHGYDVTEFPNLYGWGMYRSLLSDATLIAHSGFVERQIQKHLRRRVDRVVMGVDLSRFTSGELRGTDWPRPLRLLSVGRLSPIKGHDVAVDVLAALRQARPELDARLRIVGNGKGKASLEAQIREKELNHVISGPTAVRYADMNSEMQSADVLLICSQLGIDGWEEAFCRVAVEAMASGLAVVVTPCGGLPETVNGAGFVAQGFGCEAVKEVLLTTLETETPQSCSKKSLAVSEHYSLDQMISGYNRLSRQAAGF